MELTKNIFFNTDKLVQNSRVKISYTGKFFEEGASEVFIHFGFGTNWESVSELEMTRTEIGFQTEIDLIESDTFNFCFRNENDEWDNNEAVNYIFELEKPVLDLILLDEVDLLDRPHRLRRSYIWSKKIRLAVYKIITYVPKIISGNYKKKVSE
ncbi:MAG: hypothetical protein FWC79_01220 [Oscillospiraceae bacterium]|nr:hypothetical protein [Oscillospiraceae bacterium]